MQLRYEVSPSEAGIVVDGLHAQGFRATQDNLALGDETVVVSIDDVEADRVGDVERLMLELASTATPVSRT